MAPYAFCIKPGEMTNAGTKTSNVQPESGPPECKKSRNVAGTSAVAAMPLNPPAFASTVGTAIRNPTSSTVSCTTLIHAVPSSPPAMNVVVTTNALMIVPSHVGTPATTLRTAAPAIN